MTVVADTDLHRRKRRQNRVLLILLLGLAALFYAITIVRMGGQG